MARRRPSRPARSTGRARSAAHGVRWLWIAVLILIGVAVFAARTVKLPRSAQPATVEAKPAAEVVTPVAARATPVATQAVNVAAATATHAVHTSTPRPAVTPSAAAVVKTAGVIATATPAVRMPGPNGTVALTFDAGADRGYADDILDILQEQHVVASFGITGVWAKANPDLVRRMAADGHFVFNHTLDHRSFTGVSDKLGGLSPARRRAELDDADAIIAPLIGHTTRPFYRLPYGDDDAQVAADLAADGYTHKIGWTIDSLGWRGAQSSDIVARCVTLGASGAVYVFHVGRASQDAIALPQVIGGLRDKGFTFRRVDQT